MNSQLCSFLFLLFHFEIKVNCDISFSTTELNKYTSLQTSINLLPSRCNFTALISCFIGFSNIDVFRYVIDETILALACLQVLNSKKCFAEIGKNCTEIEKLHTISNTKGLDYICNVNNPGYNKMQACFKDEKKYIAYNTYFDNCSDSIENTIVDYNVTGQQCKRNNGYYSCFVNASQYCDARDFMINYYQLYYGDQMSIFFQCNSDYSNWNTTQVYSECNIQKFIQCLVNDISFFNIFESLSIITARINISSYCNSATSIQNCIINKAKCDNTDFLGYSFIWAYLFLCNEGKTEYNKHSQCYENNKSFFNSCMGLLSRDCIEFNAFYKCMVSSAKKLCDDGIFIHNYVYEILKPLLKDMNCTLNMQFNSTTNAKDGELGSHSFPVYALLIMALFISKCISNY